MSYDKHISMRVSLKQNDCLENYAGAKGKKPQDILREYIDSIETNPNIIKDDIEFFKYKIAELKKLLVNIDEEKKTEEKTVEVKYKEQKTKQRHAQEDKELKDWEQPIIKQIITKYGNYVDLEGAELEAANTGIIGIAKQALVKEPKDKRLKLLDRLLPDLNKYFFNFDEEKYDSVVMKMREMVQEEEKTPINITRE